MKITKSELKEMIREALREELNNRSITEGAMNGGYAENGSLDTGKRAGGAKKVWKDALDGKKTKTVKAKDLKPGMITSTGEVKKVTSVGWMNGEPSVEVSYGGIGAQGSHASDVVSADRDYEVLDESIAEGIFDKFKKKQKQEPATKQEEPAAEEPKKEEKGFETYSYDEWIQALEYGHKYYAEDGPEAGKTKLWDKAMEISASENLCKDVTACMDAWMKQKGNNNFPHKSYAKHLEEDIDPENIFDGLFNFNRYKIE
jgi:hypothetical protein